MCLTGSAETLKKRTASSIHSLSHRLSRNLSLARRAEQVSTLSGLVSFSNAVLNLFTLDEQVFPTNPAGWDGPQGFRFCFENIQSEFDYHMLHGNVCMVLFSILFSRPSLLRRRIHTYIDRTYYQSHSLTCRRWVKFLKWLLTLISISAQTCLTLFRYKWNTWPGITHKQSQNCERDQWWGLTRTGKWGDCEDHLPLIKKNCRVCDSEHLCFCGCAASFQSAVGWNSFSPPAHLFTLLELCASRCYCHVLLCCFKLVIVS